MAAAVGRRCEPGLEEHQRENCHHQRVLVARDIRPIIISFPIFILLSPSRILLSPTFLREPRQFFPRPLILSRNPLNLLRKKTSLLAETSSNSSYFQSPSQPTSAKTGNYTASNTGKKRTKDGPICGSNCAPDRRTMAVPATTSMDGSGGFHGNDDPRIQSEIPTDPFPERRITLSKLRPNDVALFHVPVHPNLEPHLAAARTQAWTRPMTHGQLVVLGFAAAAVMPVVANSGGGN